MTRPYIAVVGGGIPDSDDDVAAEQIGRAVAEDGAVVVCGGITGVMEAACRGAKSAGGTTVGILPGLDRTDANPHVDIAIPTGLGEMRNALVVRAADAVIAVGGEYGTLSEVAFALKTGVPVVGVRTWELAKAGLADDGVVRIDDPTQAVREAIRLAGQK